MLNTLLFQKINDLAGQYVWLDRTGVFLSVYLGYILVAVLLFILIFRWSAKNSLMFWSAAISALAARLGVTSLIRFFYHHPRPFDVMPVHQLIGESGSSFPSGHASFFFALSAAVYVFNKKLGIIFFISSALIGLGRIYAGVHWPADVLGGAAVGIITGWLIGRFFEKLKPSS